MATQNTIILAPDAEAPVALSLVKSLPPGLDLAFAARIVTEFLSRMQQQCARLDPTLPAKSKGSIFHKLDHFLASEIKHFSASLTAPATAETGQRASKAHPMLVLMSRLRYFCKQIVPYDVQLACRRNKLVFELYRMLFIPHDSAVIGGLAKFGLAISPAMMTRIQRVTARARFTYDSQRLSDMDRAALAAVATRILEKDQERFAQALVDAAAFNADASPKKAVFVSAIFQTTLAPMVRALNARGWTTAWLGTRNIQEFVGYGSVATREIPVTLAYPSSFLGTLVFMAALSPQARILLNGEAYYGANWNGEDALILYMLNQAIAETIRAHRAPQSSNLFFLMYDGLKPVAKSRELKNEVSKYYRDFIQSPDKIIYNSNLELFGEYVENSYGANRPRLHFMRYSEPPKTPIPMLDFGPNGDTFHMVCITVCLNEFEEPSRDSGPTFVRAMIEQGIHFHYYCVENDPAIARFRDSLKADYRGYFHTHAIIKDQQALVDELCQYHVAFNPADHMPFSQGITQLNDREYQDGMATFWQSTVGTSFLVYAAAGLPSILPRGCTAAGELLKDTAIPVYLSELKNIRNHFKKIDLRARRERLSTGSPVGWIDTHIEKLIEFIQ